MASRGEIWWYEHPLSGRRPFLVLTRSEAIPVLNQVLAVPLTSNIRGIPTEVVPDEDDGLSVPCVASLDNLTQIRPAFCNERIGALAPDRMEAVREALRVSVAC